MSYSILVLICLLGALVGLFYLLFKKGKRNMGALAAFLFFLAMTIFAVMDSNQKAIDAGWQSAEEMNDAKRAGIFDPLTYQKVKGKLEREAKAKDAADALARAEAAAEVEVKKAAEDAFFKPPSDQNAVVSTVENARVLYKSAENDLVKGGVRRDRARSLCNAVPSFSISGWTGTLTNLTTNGDGLGVIEVTIGEDITVMTMNNALSDIGSNTLIDPDSEVFKKLSTLKTGQRVKFSGTFIEPPTKVDCLYESSLTMNGSMRDPAFIIRFSDIRTN